MLFSLIFITLAVCCSPVVSQRRSCSRDRMRQCQETLQRSIQRRILDGSRSEILAQCEIVRDDFNCLLEETRCLSSETERNRNGNTLRNALNYIRDGCDKKGSSWRESSCYIGEGMKTCESSYPLGGSQFSSHNPETCRKFNLFQDCVMENIRSRCRSDDERLLGQYMVDTAQDLAWNCGESTTTSDWGRGRDDPYRTSERNRDRDSDWDSDRNWDRDRDRSRDPWRNGSGDRGSSRDGQYDRDRERYPDRDGDRSSDRDRDRYPDRSGRNGGYDRTYGSSDITCCRNERCSTSRLQQCKDSLSRTIDSRQSGNQDLQRCRKARDDFNCLLWQTANCQRRSDRDRDNDLFRRARDYISSSCNTYGRWSENTCFKSTEMQRCENSLPSTRGGATYEACRSYNRFQECMQDELQRRCTREDDLYQGAYLVDKANELSWQCENDQYSSNGRNQYFTNDNRRDPYDTNSNYGGYDSNPPHLDDDDSMCLSRIQSYTDQCKVTLDDKRKEVYIENDYDQRQRIICCSARQYRSCLFDATRRVCQAENTRVVDSLMGRFGYELSSDQCRRIYEGDCSSGSYYQISFFILFICLVILPRFFTYYLP